MILSFSVFSTVLLTNLFCSICFGTLLRLSGPMGTNTQCLSQHNTFWADYRIATFPTNILAESNQSVADIESLEIVDISEIVNEPIAPDSVVIINNSLEVEDTNVNSHFQSAQALLNNNNQYNISSEIADIQLEEFEIEMEIDSLMTEINTIKQTLNYERQKVKKS